MKEDIFWKWTDEWQRYTHTFAVFLGKYVDKTVLNLGRIPPKDSPEGDHSGGISGKGHKDMCPGRISTKHI